MLSLAVMYPDPFSPFLNVESYYHADITQWYNLENVKGPCVYLLCLEVFRALFPAVLPPKPNSGVA
jgi:hypothetical protein